MKYLIVFLIFFSQGSHAADWFEGMWVYDEGLTHRNTPGLTPLGKQEVRAAFDQYAGKITVTKRRVKGKKAKLGVPYRVVGRGSSAVMLEVKGPGVELVKAFNPNLRKQSLRCKVTRISSNVVAFEVPDLNTIRMYLRRTG